MSWPVIPDLRKGEHVIVIGPTGTGKTFLMERFLRSYPYAIVLDSKDDIRWKGWKRTRKLDATYNVDAGHIIVAPDRRVYVPTAEALFGLVYQQRNWTVAVDEVYSLGHSYAEVEAYTPTYLDLLTRGRGRGITVWTGTQRPRFLPIFAFTESKHYFIFRVDSEDDLKVLERQTTKKTAQLVSALTGHQFVYYDKSSGAAIKSVPLRR